MAVTYPELLEHPRCLAGVRYPHPSLEDTYQPGVTESWIAQLVCSLLVASGGKTVLETGGFMGITSSWLALTLERMGGGHLTVCEIEPDRRNIIAERLSALETSRVGYTLDGDVLAHLRADLPPYDFVWLDDDHSADHVRAEVNALWPKMAHNGLIVFHDVVGSVDLQRVVREFGGYSLDLPRLGPAGGLGVIQVR